MKFLRRFYMLILILICILGGMYLSQGYFQPEVQVKLDSSVPIISSKSVIMDSYNAEGILNFKINAKTLDFYEDSGETHFQSPVLVLFKDGKISDWQIKSNLATLTKDQILVLTEDVLISSLSPDNALKNIYTEYLVIDLATQDFSGDRPVLIQGVNFESQGDTIKGNLGQQVATLKGKVKSKYETQ
jgi:lipopolysaccharide export system protein LptC